MSEEGPKVCSTADLMEMHRKSKSKGLSALPPHLINDLDPEGKHIIAMILWGHNMERAKEPLWHRVRLFAKVKGTSEPYEQQIEVFDNQWSRLHNAKDWLEENADEVVSK